MVFCIYTTCIPNPHTFVDVLIGSDEKQKTSPNGYVFFFFSFVIVEVFLFLLCFSVSSRVEWRQEIKKPFRLTTHEIYPLSRTKGQEDNC